MKKGDKIRTPRFLTVTLTEVFDNLSEAYKQGFTEPTHYHEGGYTVLGKSTGTIQMIFAGCKYSY